MTKESLKKKILVADDQEGNQILMKYILEKKGYEVLVASDGEEAIEVATEMDPDLVLMDVVMPGMDGYEACKILKDNPKTKNIPIVMITSLNDVTDKVKGLEVGADDFMSKPPNEVELTARVKSLIRMKDQQKEIEQLRNDFTAMLVHDLRAPLTSVLGFTDLISSSDDLTNEEKTEYLNIISISGRKMLALINDILDVSKLESGDIALNYSRVNLAQVITENIEKNHGLFIQKHLTVQKNLDETISIRIDQGKIDQVLTNLISNAAKFSFDNGVIKIDVSKNENSFICKITDTGTGIQENELPFIFEKYKQASTGKSHNFKGTGLGLYISRMMMEAHKGSISVESKPGFGTSFSLVFPAESSS